MEHVKRIEQRDPARLIPNARNPRMHPPEQVAKIARSISVFGFNNPILVHGDTIVAGHGRWQAAALLELDSVPVIDLSHLSEAEARAYLLADNKAQEGAVTDAAAEAAALAELHEAEFDLSAIGYSDTELEEALRAAAGEPRPPADPDAGAAEAEPPADPVTKPGDLWLLGEHRLLCGDSTDPASVRLACGDMFGAVALLLADPPYGMGKESEGVANDNLYRDKLDAFQWEWLEAARPALPENGSVFVWGNAADLWRWWYGYVIPRIGEPVAFKNEIVWNKKSTPGMASPLETSYPTVTERALFFVFGEQFLGNLNADLYWEGFEPVRLWVAGEIEANGWTRGDVNRITGTNMAGHWIGRSQFQVLSRKHYNVLQAAAEADGLPGFRIPYDDFCSQVATVDVTGGGREHARDLAQEFRASKRTYFDNAHQTMTDVWEFPRVYGEERLGHPTPKPVAMLERAIISSTPAGGFVLEPFGGTGTTLIAAERTGRRCAMLEIDPGWCDVIVDRWERFTGRKAERGDGR